MFVPAQVNIGQRPVTVQNLTTRLSTGGINLSSDPRYLEGSWSLQRQSRFIEFLMLKIPIPAFYFRAVDDDRWLVIDGLQRLTAIQNFLVGVSKDNQKEQPKEKLAGLQYFGEYNGYTFDDLPRQFIRRIKETPLTVYIVEQGTPDEIAHNIYQRLRCCEE